MLFRLPQEWINSGTRHPETQFFLSGNGSKYTWQQAFVNICVVIVLWWQVSFVDVDAAKGDLARLCPLLFVHRIFELEFGSEVIDTVTMVSQRQKKYPSLPILTDFWLFTPTPIRKFSKSPVKMGSARFWSRERIVTWDLIIWNQGISIRRNGHTCFFFWTPNTPLSSLTDPIFFTLETLQGCTEGLLKKRQRRPLKNGLFGHLQRSIASL